MVRSRRLVGIIKKMWREISEEIRDNHEPYTTRKWMASIYTKRKKFRTYTWQGLYLGLYPSKARTQTK